MRSLRLHICCPAPAGTTYGNRVTALNWARLLRGQGHRVRIGGTDASRLPASDLLIALHARHSSETIQRCRMETPDRPIILALTGTDLYRDIHRNQSARQALSLADRLVLLHDKAPGDLPPRLRSRAHVIFQSAKPTPIKRATAVTQFRVVVIGHMRHEKDPFRTAMAVRSLPASSTIEVEHYGAAREPRMAELARREMKRNPRYRWFGTQPNWKVRRRLARAQLLVLSSRMEGGANVLSEALADQIPILAARISCTRGVLGDSYKGFFEVGDTRALRDLLLKAELDTAYLKTLCSQCKRRRHLIDPRNEARAWKQLLGALISN